MHYMKEKIKEYLEWKGTYAKRASVNYRIWLERLVEVYGEEKKLEDYTITDYIKFKCWLETRYKSYSLQFATIVIKNFFQYCKYQNYPCSISPTLIKLPRIIAKSHRAITEDEFEKIISGIQCKDFLGLRDLLLIQMLWDTGVRVSELCDLDLSQITENNNKAVISTKKTGRKRIIVWSKTTHTLLLKYMQKRLALKNAGNNSALFVGKSNGKGWSNRITSRTIQRIIKESVKNAGINERITPHSFRHGWAHKRRDKNAPLSFIQRGLGHLNPVSTFIYEQYNDVDFVKTATDYLKTA